MKIRWVALLSAMSLTLSACGTIRLKYQAHVADAKGQEKVATVVKSYPVGGAFKPLCYITAIGFGGMCWFYLVMPTVDQKQEVRADALKILKEKFPDEQLQVKSDSVEKIGWEKEDISVKLEAPQD